VLPWFVFVGRIYDVFGVLNISFVVGSVGFGEGTVALAGAVVACVFGRELPVVNCCVSLYTLRCVNVTIRSVCRSIRAEFEVKRLRQTIYSR
jgi:hypothetical protein